MNTKLKVTFGLVALFIAILVKKSGVFEGLMKDDLNLAVCVLSARNHVELRDAVRQSWMNDVGRIRKDYEGSVVVRFVVGMSACPFPPEDRISPYSCQEWSPQIPAQAHGSTESLQVFRAQLGEPMTRPVMVAALYIKVMHPITLRRLGLAEFLPLHSPGESFHVIMYDGVTEEEVCRGHFKGSSQGRVSSGYLYRPVQEMTLPKHYEFTLEVSLVSQTSQDNSQPLDLQDLGWASQTSSRGPAGLGANWTVVPAHSNLLHIEFLRDGLTSWPKLDNVHFLPLISLAFDIAELSTLQQHIASRPQRQQATLRRLSKEYLSLQEEQSLHGDLMEVELMDVYSNLPDKVIMCHDWFSQTYNSRFVVKTDDDCWLNLYSLYTKLDTLTPAPVWWGNFRTGWLVERHGKWRESRYTGLTYPSFACGSGSVLSGDVGAWLASQQPRLQRYQGEDVSMGIWLAAVQMDLHHDPAWRCDKTCRPQGTLAIPQLTAEEITFYWNNSRHCTSPCEAC